MKQIFRLPLSTLSFACIAVSGWGAVACSGGLESPPGSMNGSGTGSGDTTGIQSPSASPGSSDLGSADGGLALGTEDSGVAAVDGIAALPEPVCDESGENCTCINMALVGTLDSNATDKDTGAFTDWLNNNSGGSAVVTNVTEKPTLTQEYLRQFHVIVLANINGWLFSEEEKAAVADWVSSDGGGLIALTGFNSDAQEVIDTSQLLSFAGFSYVGAGQSDWTANNGQNTSVFYQGGMTDLKNCLPSDPNGGAVITTAVPINDQTGEFEALSANLDYVGAYIGWSVQAPAEATVLATDPISGKTIAAAQKVGNGKVFAFGDEWVIFRNQWEGVSTNGDPKCSLDGAGGAEKHGVNTLYQTKQFWYNAISWSAPPNECFQITDNEVIIR
ncbi:MAG: hypothetical protein MK135_16300 [Polyangiaceae bacterium]|nr:hypothetical protein [Polyangiaceae bacterium]